MFDRNAFGDHSFECGVETFKTSIGLGVIWRCFDARDVKHGFEV